MTVENVGTVRRLGAEALLTKRTGILGTAALVLFVEIQRRLVREWPRAAGTPVDSRLVLTLTRSGRARRLVHRLNRQIRVVLHQLHDLWVDALVALRNGRDAHVAEARLHRQNLALLHFVVHQLLLDRHLRAQVNNNFNASWIYLRFDIDLLQFFYFLLSVGDRRFVKIGSSTLRSKNSKQHSLLLVVIEFNWLKETLTTKYW